MGGGRPHVHARHILLALCDITLGDHIRVHALLYGLLDDLIIHVRKIRDKVHFIAFILKIPPHRVKYDHGTGIPDMDQVIHRRAAHIDLHPPGL